MKILKNNLKKIIALYTIVVLGLLTFGSFMIADASNMRIDACMDNCTCIPWGTIEERTQHCLLCEQKAYDPEIEQCVSNGNVNIGTSCPDGSGKTTTHCAVFDCPLGDTNNDGQCTLADSNASYKTYSAGACPAAPASNCGQIDWYTSEPNGSWNQGEWNANYCGFTVLNFFMCNSSSLENPNVEIVKSLNSGSNPFDLASTIPFRIEITNTGNTTLKVVRFEDNFDRNYLQYISGEVTFKGQTKNLAGIINLIDIDNIGNQESLLLRIPDLTSVFGADLAPNEKYVLVLNFRAMKVGNTENIATVFADNLTDNDNEVVVIENDIPTTDPNIQITKTARNDIDGDKNFLIGVNATFDIKLQNIGPTDLNYVRFIDQYDSVRLQYLSGSISRYNTQNQVIGTINNINDVLAVNNTGYLEVANIAASVIGGLKPNEYYVVTLTFLTKAQGNAQNIGIVDARDTNGKTIPRKQDDDVISIENVNTDV